MNLRTPEDLLLELEWPRGYLDQRGVLSWSTALNAVTVATAAVVVTEKMLTLRYRLMTIGKGVATPLEAKWILDEGPYAHLASLKSNGSSLPLDDRYALQQFRSFKQMLGVAPKFERHGPREAAIDVAFPNL